MTLRPSFPLLDGRSEPHSDVVQVLHLVVVEVLLQSAVGAVVRLHSKVSVALLIEEDRVGKQHLTALQISVVHGQEVLDELGERNLLSLVEVLVLATVVVNLVASSDGVVSLTVGVLESKEEFKAAMGLLVDELALPFIGFGRIAWQLWIWLKIQVIGGSVHLVVLFLLKLLYFELGSFLSLLRNRISDVCLSIDELTRSSLSRLEAGAGQSFA